MRNNLPRIGARTVKTAVAATVCLMLFMGIEYAGSLLSQAESSFLSAFGDFLSKQEPAFGCVAAVICMQQTVKNSLRSGAYRLLGTAAGGAIGITLLWLNNIVLDGKLLLLWFVLGIILSIWFVLLMKRPDAAAICAVTLIIVLLTVKREAPYLYALNRIIGTALGIAVSVAVNRYVHPLKSQNLSNNDDEKNLEEKETVNNFLKL